MHRTLLLAFLSLGTSLALSVSDAQAWGVPPIKVDVTFRFDVSSTQLPPPSYPWWTYFPYDPHLMTPANRPVYPNWVPHTQAAQGRSALPPPGAAPPNVVWQPGAHAPVQPASFHGPPSGFAFDR